MRVALLLVGWLLGVAALSTAPRPEPPLLDLLPQETDATSAATPAMDATSSATWLPQEDSP